jgi:hypothetical protein
MVQCFPYFFWINFTISSLTFRFLILLESMLAQGGTPSSGGGNPVFPAPFVEEAVFSPKSYLGLIC